MNPYDVILCVWGGLTLFNLIWTARLYREYRALKKERESRARAALELARQRFYGHV